MSNQTFLVQKLSAQASTLSSADADNLSAFGGHIVIDVTAITGTTPTLTVSVEGKDPVSGKYYTILTSAAISTVSTTVLRIFPSATASANTIANDIIPRTFRVTSTLGGTTPVVTATIVANFVD